VLLLLLLLLLRRRGEVLDGAHRRGDTQQRAVLEDRQ
jgi:hypothetical protein